MRLLFTCVCFCFWCYGSGSSAVIYSVTKANEPSTMTFQTYIEVKYDSANWAHEKKLFFSDKPLISEFKMDGRKNVKNKTIIMNRKDC